jgi:type VI secretion system protein ImpB
MAQESSVAPKERVNIRYKPATGDAKEEVELPFKMVMLGDYTMRQDDTPLDQRQRININKDNFQDVMKSQKLSLDLKVANKLEDGPDAGDIAVSLQVDTLKDFEPEQVVRKVPELRKLLELREALTALKGPLGNMPAFRKAIQGVMDNEGARSQLLAELTGGKEEPKAE